MTDTTTTATADEIEDAAAALAAAEDALSDVQRRIIDDDPPTATAVDLIRAEATVSERRSVLERARQVVAQRRERAEERQRQERLADYRRLIVERFGEHDGDVVDAFDAAVAALGRLVELGVAHNAGFAEIAAALRELLRDDDLTEMRVGTNQIHLPGWDVFLGPIKVDGLVAEAAARALDNHGQGPGVLGSGHLSQVAGHQVDVLQSLGLAAGDRMGLSDYVRRTARIVAERGAS